MRITAWPARHFSGRMPWDRFQTLWSSFVIEGPRHRVYFGADSGWWDGFAEIASQYDGFDLTMLEIGAFHPLWSHIHLGPDGAACRRAVVPFAEEQVQRAMHRRQPREDVVFKSLHQDPTFIALTALAAKPMHDMPGAGTSGR